jgi:DNA-binding PadR family transcriptional regulator
MDVRGHLDLLLLATLARTGPAHGYAVIAALREQSTGSFDLPEGTVYPALHRLEGAGLVASRWDTSAARKRRVYALTSAGRQARVSKQREWTGFAAAMAAVTGGGTLEAAT